MYKAMIVEDEIPIRNIITKIIDWNQLGYELIYQADNGQMALEFLRENNVDLIITDISMPFMDGLELCKNIREHWPDTTIVILSGHNEFDYARKAIELGVSKYLLKPVTKASFSEVLSEIREEMDDKLSARKNLEFLRKQYYRSKDVLKNKFFNNLIMGYNQEYYMEQKEILEVSLTADKYLVATLILEGEQLENDGFWGKDRPLLDFAVLNLTEEVLREVGQDIVFLGPGNQICSIIKISEDLVDLQLILGTLERITNQVKELFNMNATIGVSEFCDSIDEMNYAYEQAVTATAYRVLEGSEKVIVISNMEGKKSYTAKRLDEQLTRLEYSIKVGDATGIRKIIIYIFSVINYEQMEIGAFRTFLMEMVITIHKTYNDIYKGDDSELLDYKTFSRLFEISDFNDIQQYFINLCNDFSNKISTFREDEEQSHVNEAIDYINSNFHDPLLTLESLCKVLFLSEGHFSRLFKKSTGITFVDYLTKVRMDQAKYLLANTGQKMYEISRNIGYEDPNYFSYNFKKHTGMTPSVWRKRGE